MRHFRNDRIVDLICRLGSIQQQLFGAGNQEHYQQLLNERWAIVNELAELICNEDYRFC